VAGKNSRWNRYDRVSNEIEVDPIWNIRGRDGKRYTEHAYVLRCTREPSGFRKGAKVRTSN
jgi:hypothetical protein